MARKDSYKQFVGRLGANLRKIRNERGLTQEEMADLGSFNYRFYQKLESGSYRPNLETIYKLTVRYGVKLDDLFA
jgi:transcriptional regulator with XRE-family HTH domain